jgi:AAHS family 4-hydroxybenzoate transporter-like MFS transporter
MFASVLAAGLFGVTVGSILGGLLGDRVGRRPVLILSVFFFAANTCGMAFTHGLHSLLLLRFFAGLGIGAALPNAATLSSEYTPLNRRPFATTLTIICIPLGGLLAGVMASALLGACSWRMLVLLSGVLPIVGGIALLVFLPESPRFLAKDVAKRQQLLTILRAIGRPVEDASTFVVTQDQALAGAKPWPASLFSGGRAKDTLALWGAFFCCLLTVYLAFNWLPSVLIASHLSSQQASEGLTLYNFGGIIGALGIGWWASLKGSRLPMSLSVVVAVASAVLLAIFFRGHAASGSLLLSIVAFHGLAVNAVQTTLYALATHLYPTQIRATGVAFALAIGRTGAIVSAYLGAGLLSLPPYQYFLTLAGTMLLVGAAINLIGNHIPMSVGVSGRDFT